MLAKLVDSIYECNFNKDLINDVNILIVDNDAEETAKETGFNLAKKLDKKFKLFYYAYPVKGLSNVRNKLIQKALLYKPDFIVFVDDDEFVSKNWLNELALTIVGNEGDMVRGPVISVFNRQVPDYLSVWFQNLTYKNNEQIKLVETNNLIISTPFLLKSKINFDKRFNTTGGEDTYFGFKALDKGAKIYWAEKAIVYETIPENRTTLKWIFFRTYREAITYIYILKLEKKYFRLLKKLLATIVYLFIGIAGLILTPFQLRSRYWGALKLAESLGGFAGLFGFKYHEYSKR